jgi:3-isopropylmalate/(R)-2-methylmalate dehydratase small subunit
MGQGRAFVFGDRIDTDVLAPGSLMKLAPEELAKHCLAAIAPGFAKSVQKGDFVVAGDGFGIGSSREQAAVSLKVLGVQAVIARSFARIFYRNAFNLGLPAVTLARAGEIKEGDVLSLDLKGGKLHNMTQHCLYEIAQVPPHLLALIEDGGLINSLKRQFPAKGGGGHE